MTKLTVASTKIGYIKDYDWLLQGCEHQCVNYMIVYCRGVETDVLTV